MRYLLEIEKVLSKAVININSISDINSPKFLSLKKLSIDKIKENNRIEGTWIGLANEILNRSKMIPIEACLLLAYEINKDKYEYDNNIEMFNNYVIDKLIEENSYNINGECISKLISCIKLSNNDRYKINSVLKEKLKKLRKISIHDDSIVSGFIYVKVKSKGINKNEIYLYYPEMDNYFFTTDTEITIFRIDSGEKFNDVRCSVLSSYKRWYDELNEYIKNLNNSVYIDSQFVRILIYGAALEIGQGKIISRVNEDILKLIMDNEQLFCKEYIERIMEDQHLNTIDKYLNDLRDNPVESRLQSIVNKCSDIEEIIQVINYAKTIMEEISLKTYVQIILKCNEIDKYNVKIALFIEELIREKPLIIDEIVSFLMELYSENIFTENTMKTLDYLSCTVADNPIIEKARIIIKCRNKSFDSDFFSDFIRFYTTTDNKEELDGVLNSIINNEDLNINDNMADCIYNFYIRNDDVNSLNILCRHWLKSKDEIPDFITEEDIEKILDLYSMRNITIDICDYLLYISRKYKDNEKILENVLSLLQKPLKSNRNILITYIQKYIDIFKYLSEKDDDIYNLYILSIIEKCSIEKKYEADYIEDLLKAVEPDNHVVDIQNKISAISFIVEYYSNNHEYDKCIEILNMYFKNYAEFDSNSMFRKLVSVEYKNTELMESILKNIDFAGVSNLDILLNLVGNKLLNAGKYDMFYEILRYITKTGFYSASMEMILKYVQTADKIDDITYDSFVKNILSNLNDKDQKELYNNLIKRQDMPADIREEYFSLNPCDENKEILIKEFEDENTETAFVKKMALEKYFNDDDRFISLIDYGDNSKEVYDIIWEKCKEKFKDNKETVEEILMAVEEKDSRLADMEEWIDNYMAYEFVYEKRYIFDNFKVIKKDIGDLCDEVILENIFTNDKARGICFKNNSLKNEIIKYLTSMSIEYKYIEKDIDSDEYEDSVDIISIDENTDNDFLCCENLISMLKNIKELIRFEINLRSRKMALIDITAESLIITENAFIPKSFNSVIELNKRAIFRDTDRFPKIKKIRNKNNSVVIDDYNLVLLMKDFISKLIIKMKKTDKQEITVKKMLKEIVLNEELMTFEELLSAIEIFISESGKNIEDISYRKMIAKFGNLENGDKLKVLVRIIEENDTTEKAKKAVLSECQLIKNISDMEVKYKLYIYLIECFNNAHEGFSLEDLELLYKNINEMTNSIIEFKSDKFYDDIVINLQNVYLNSVDSHYCCYNKKEVRKDIQNLILDDENKEYLLSKLTRPKKTHL